MKYIIELYCDLSNNADNPHWERSWAFPGEYTKAEAERLIDQESNKHYKWRIVPLNGRAPEKKYRRHAAVTPLELRGAKAMLESAIDRGFMAGLSFEAYSILVDAKIAVTCQLEKL
jgi:hypothetical protein